MSRKRIWRICLVCICLLGSGRSMAATGGGAQPVRDGETDVLAGVAVDYMGKLQYRVLDRATDAPIEGASVELYIPSLDRYVFFGLTDQDGRLELDVAYGEEDQSRYAESDGQTVFSGELLHLTDRSISYRVLKSRWLPYPYDGEVVLTTSELPQVVTVYLHRKGGGGGGGNGGGSGASAGDKPGITIPPFPGDTIGEPEPGQITGIPKTGVEGTFFYWLLGLSFFVIAGGILLYLIKTDNGGDDKNAGRRGE